MAVTDFVNPYTFVPHVGDPDRWSPAGHAEMGPGNLAGTLRVTVTAQTPLLIGGYERPGEEGSPASDVPRRADGTPMIPGSGLLGAVRSVHEALAGGCLRVLDTDWVPVHRHPANVSETRDLHMAVVLEVDGDGRATRVGLCDRWIRIDEDLLPASADGLPQTGDRLRFPVSAIDGSGTIPALRSGDVPPEEVVRVAGMNASLDDTWVLLVADTNARPAGKPVFFTAGLLGPGARMLTIPARTADRTGSGAEKSAWDLYLKVVDGADDLRTANLPGGEEPPYGSVAPEYKDVFWPVPRDGADDGDRVARRLAVRRYLHKGQPIWVRHDGAVVTEIRLSRLWRYQGEFGVGERVLEAAPCTDPGKLCWSCRVFGSADTSGRDADDVAAQCSYRGHVRFEDLLAAAGFQPQPWHLAPLASPHPGAGQFYLDNSAVTGRGRLAERDTAPAATWGSRADRDGPRPIRGRKFY